MHGSFQLLLALYYRVPPGVPPILLSQSAPFCCAYDRDDPQVCPGFICFSAPSPVLASRSEARYLSATVHTRSRDRIQLKHP